MKQHYMVKRYVNPAIKGEILRSPGGEPWVTLVFNATDYSHRALITKVELKALRDLIDEALMDWEA